MPQSQPGEISLEEVTGTGTGTGTGTSEISLADVMGGEAASTPEPPPNQAAIQRTAAAGGQLFPLASFTAPVRALQAMDLVAKPDDSFAMRSIKAAARGISQVQQHPVRSAVGAGKALVAGATGLAESAASGAEALLDTAFTPTNISKIVKGEEGWEDLRDRALSTFTSSMESTQEGFKWLHDAAERVTKLNFAPANEQDQAMADLLAILPEGITAAGDTVYEKTGSAIAGAGTQAMLTLLTLRPGIVTRMFDGPKARPQLDAALEGLSKEDPKAAEAIVEHIAEAAPQTAKKLKVKLKAAASKTPEQIGETVVKKQAEATELTPEQIGTGVSKAVAELPVSPPATAKATERPRPKYEIDEDTGQHTITSDVGSILMQESPPVLQVKRMDVDAAARGKGHAQEMLSMAVEEAQARGLTVVSDFSMSPDASRAFMALGRKGFNIKENPNRVNPETGNKVSLDPRLPVYEITKAPASEAAVERASEIFVSGPTLDSLPGGQFVKGKLTAWYDEAIRTINPEALGPEAKLSAAATANKIAEAMNRDATNHGLARERIKFWQRQPPAVVRQFIKAYESGWRPKDPLLAKAADNMRQRNAEINAQDIRNGIEYDPIDNYLYHIFENGEKLAAHFQAKYGAKWGDPKFTKDREFKLYDEAIAAGFKPKFTNPEDIMLARQHASDISQMQIELLRDLETYGLAQRAKKGAGQPAGSETVYRRAPNGEGFWVDAKAHAILHNAFDTKSLWNMPGIRGDVFRGAMFLKNAIVPIKLALSLFHPLHVATIDNATGMVRASKELLAGKMSATKWLGKMIEAGTYGSKGIPFKGIWDNPATGNRLLRAYQGKIDPAKLTAADVQSLQYMAEGGMIPEMSVQYKNAAADGLRKGITQAINERGAQRIEGAAKTVWYLPFAIIQALQKPMFEIWIPSLKIASYLRDVQTALRTNPALVQNKAQRLLAFRKLAKSVDNRYGEMAYNTLFWNRTVKDLAVANTLSLGWNLGFIREYGGGALDIGQSVIKKGSLSQKASTGMLDRPLFVTFYTTQALLYGGLLTYALSGSPPQSLMDYVYPKNGNVDSKDQPERMNTMFYPREFAAIAKHIEHEGAASGLTHLVANKASGVVGLVKQWWTGRNWMDQEIRDPDSPWYEQMQQTLKATLSDLEPISSSAIRESSRSAKDVALSVSGFSKAPKYVSQSTSEAHISSAYRKYVAPKQTPYEAALLSNDRRALRQAYDRGDMAEFDDLLDQMTDKYDLTSKEQIKLQQTVIRDPEYNPYATMFERLPWQQQKSLLDQMTPEEREEYLPLSNKEHLRFSYEEPEARQ